MNSGRKPNPIGHLLGYILVSLVFIIGPFFWKVDVGDRTLSTVEAWEMGVAQITVAMGILLLFLSVFLWRGALWPRWPIIFWYPFNFLTNIGWSILNGVGTVNPEDWVGGIMVMLFWIWGLWRHFFGKSE
jgi:hypothetical protein